MAIACASDAPAQPSASHPRLLPAVAFLLSALMLVPPAAAHEINTANVTVVVGDAGLAVEFVFDPKQLDDEFAADADGNGAVSQAELEAAAPAIVAFLRSNATVAADGEPVQLEDAVARLAEDEAGDDIARLSFNASTAEAPDQVALSLAPRFFAPFPDRFTVLAKVVDGDLVLLGTLSASDLHESWDLSSPPSVLENVWGFTVLGIEHIFLGYDHIMFLLALLLAGGKLRDLVKIVTAFTVGHSVTLILAALEVIALPPTLIEVAIALSIAYVAAENLWVKSVEKRWIITGLFGLVHGFGFANVLAELGLPRRGLVASLLAFNVGVEIGQLAIVLVIFPAVLWLAKKPYRNKVLVGVSLVILLFGLGWAVERALGLSYMPF